MRISDWSSDVCSSDLALACIREIARLRGLYPARPRTPQPLPEPEATPTNPHAVEDDVAEALAPERTAPEEESTPEDAPGTGAPGTATPTYPHAVTSDDAPHPPAEPQEPAAPPEPEEPEIDRKSTRLNSSH